MKSYQQFSVMLGLIIVLYGEQALSQVSVPAKPTEEYTQETCNQRRLLRFEQLWNLYWTRNEFILKSESEQKALRNTMENTRAPKISLLSFDEATAQIEKDGEVLAKKLKSEGSVEAQRNLDYLRKALLPNLRNCAYFAGSRRAFNREFANKLGPATNSIHIPKGPGDVAAEVKVVETISPVENQTSVVARPADLPVAPPQPQVIVIAPEQMTGSR